MRQVDRDISRLWWQLPDSIAPILNMFRQLAVSPSNNLILDCDIYRVTGVTG